jgi:DNA mismatch endonuclease, patch repair protein
MPAEDPALRSRTMRAVKSTDTKPEMKVRRLLHSLGYRYRLHRKDLPGAPDVVFPVRRKIIFIHGCFWHGHDCARGARVPATNRDYWLAKVGRNRARDERTHEALLQAGWEVLIVWECTLKDHAALQKQLTDFLGAAKTSTTKL